MPIRGRNALRDPVKAVRRRLVASLTTVETRCELVVNAKAIVNSLDIAKFALIKMIGTCWVLLVQLSYDRPCLIIEVVVVNLLAASSSKEVGNWPKCL